MTVSEHPFPDFTLDVALPEGFTDISWGNDSCPSYQNEEIELILYIDYAEPDKREHPDTERFTLMRTVEGQHTGNKSDHLLTTDNYAEMIERIDAVRAELLPGPKL